MQIYMRGVYKRIVKRSFCSTSNIRLFKEQINVLYDSKCNLCLMEISFLMKKDKEDKILFTDLESEYNENDPKNGDVSYEQAMQSMHAVKFNGEVISGVKVFKELYEVIGLGYLYSFITLPIVGPLVDRIYKYWAKYRTNLTRGISIDDLVRQRNARFQQKMDEKGENLCTTTACEIKVRLK